MFDEVGDAADDMDDLELWNMRQYCLYMSTRFPRHKYKGNMILASTGWMMGELESRQIVDAEDRCEYDEWEQKAMRAIEKRTGLKLRMVPVEKFFPKPDEEEVGKEFDIDQEPLMCFEEDKPKAEKIPAKDLITKLKQLPAGTKMVCYDGVKMTDVEKKRKQAQKDIKSGKNTKLVSDYIAELEKLPSDKLVPWVDLNPEVWDELVKRKESKVKNKSKKAGKKSNKPSNEIQLPANGEKKTKKSKYKDVYVCYNNSCSYRGDHQDRPGGCDGCGKILRKEQIRKKLTTKTFNVVETTHHYEDRDERDYTSIDLIIPPKMVNHMISGMEICNDDEGRDGCRLLYGGGPCLDVGYVRGGVKLSDILGFIKDVHERIGKSEARGKIKAALGI